MKQRNKLYSNTKNIKSRPAGTKVVLTQPINLDNQKVMIEAIYYLENMFLNFAHFHLQRAEGASVKIKKNIQKQSQKDLPFLEGKDGKNELLHHGFSVVIYSYCAIEAYFNVFIEKFIDPKESEELLNNKSLQEKIELLSMGLLIDHIKQKDSAIRSSFCEIENMRHDIIHCRMKYFFEDGTDWSRLLLSKVLNNKFRKFIETAISIIEYYKPHEPKNNSNSLNVIRTGLQAKPIK